MDPIPENPRTLMKSAAHIKMRIQHFKLGIAKVSGGRNILKPVAIRADDGIPNLIGL